MKHYILKLSGKALDKIYADDFWVNKIKALKESCDGLIIVHGAGTLISEWSEKLGCTVEFKNGQRVTNEGIMDVVAAVQAGLVNHKLTAFLQNKGIESTGLSGIDRGLFTADYLNKEIGYVGIPKLTGNTRWLKTMMKQGVLPVFSSVCADADGNLMNVNADVFAERLAEAVKADTVLFLSDVAGVKLNGEVQSHIEEATINHGIKSGEISGGMIPKLESCVQLLKNGVNKVWIGSDECFRAADDVSFENLRGTWIVRRRA